MDYEALARKFGGASVQPQAEAPAAPSWASDLSRKDQAEIKIKMNQEGRKRLADLQSDIADGGSIMNDLNEFGRLNRENSTGSWWQQLTPDKQMFRSDGSMQMSAIQSRLAPSQRPPGSGASSDRDVSLFLKSLPNTGNYGNTNQGIREDFERKYNLAIEKSNAMKAHLDATGNLTDFDGQWAQRKPPANSAVPPAPKSFPQVSPAAINDLKMRGPKADAQFDLIFGQGAAARARGGN